MARLALIEGEGTVAGADSAAPAVLVVDDERFCVEANRAACELFGRSRGEIVGQRFDELVSAGMRERLEHVWQAFAQDGGHAGPFEAAPGLEVELALTPNVVAGRHLLMLAPAARGPRRRRFAASAGTVQGPRTPSARECEVLQLLASGATDPQIASMLGLSPATVQTHVRNAKAKLGARTRAQAVAIAIDHDLISAQPSAR